MHCPICQREECEHTQADINRVDTDLIAKQLGQPFDKVLEAARMLYNDGNDAILSASQLVGKETALVMLIVHIIHMDNPQQGYPMGASTKYVIMDVLVDAVKQLE